jgi:DNA-binding MarR family transcriptional regulator
MSVSELAARLGISHPSVSETRASLQKAGLIRDDEDPKDRRRRLLGLTPVGLMLVHQLRPVWKALDQAAIDLEAEADGLLAALDRLERALLARSFYDRAKTRLGLDPPAGGGE